MSSTQTAPAFRAFSTSWMLGCKYAGERRWLLRGISGLQLPRLELVSAFVRTCRLHDDQAAASDGHLHRAQIGTWFARAYLGIPPTSEPPVALTRRLSAP
jgi:hypothetical protein